MASCSPPAPTTVILQAGRSSVQQRCCSRRAILLCGNVIRIGRGRPLPPWTLQAEPFFFAATNNRIGRGTRGAAGTGATPTAFNLGLCRLRGILSPPASSMPVAGETIPRQNPAVIRKSVLEIKNQCTKEGVNGEKLTSIRKSGLEIKNQCTHEGINREDRAGHPQHAFIR